MYVRFHSCAQAALTCALISGGASLIGCGVALPIGSAETLGLSATLEDSHQESLDNDVLGSAEGVQLSGTAKRIQGEILTADDVDIYDLGAVAEGDHVIVTMQTNAGLDGAVALLDASGSILLVDDHRNVYLGRSEPFIDVVIRRKTESCFVVVTSAPGYGAQGTYELLASINRNTDVPAARPDRILLVFHGGENVRIGGRPVVNVPPFDAFDIDEAFAFYTESIMQRVVAEVRDDYAGLNIDIVSTSEGATFDGEMTRVFFGTHDPELLGIAQGVDEFNSTKRQSAIVFTNTFEAFASLKPDVEHISQAIANVASHEIGHLLGLVHTADPLGIMDITASLGDLMEDQSFRRSPIHEEVFPMGYQDEFTMLGDAVGRNYNVDPESYSISLTAKPSHERLFARAKSGPLDLPARAQFRFATCDGTCSRDARKLGAVAAMSMHP